MTTEDFIIELFCQVDDKMLNATKHSQAMLFPSEVVTLALLFALKGRGNRAFYRWLEAQFPDGLVMFDDNIVFAQSYFDVSDGNHYFPNSGIASLGHAIPAAIGASFAATDSPTFAVLGDGGFQMCCMEIMTAVNYRVPLNIVVINNGTMGLIRKNQFQLYGERYIDCDFRNPDFAALARAFGIAHYRLETQADVDRLFAPVQQAAGRAAGAVAVGVGPGEDAAGAAPHAVVADLDAPEGRNQVEGTEAIGSDVCLDLQVQHVVPLGEVPGVVLPLVALDDGPDLHAVEAVNRESSVEELERRSRRRENSFMRFRFSFF